jgi:sensor histidine kinase YesM
VTLLDDLSHLLRSSYKNGRQCSVKEEMELSRTYLELQKIRMGERLSFTISCPPALGDLEMPQFILQPLIENGVVRGLEPKKEGGSIKVILKLRDDSLCATIKDDGVGLPEEITDGVGLSNVRERLSLLYGSDASLQVRANENGGTVSSITIPV